MTLYVATAEFSLAYGDDQSLSFPKISLVFLSNYIFFLIFLSSVQPLLLVGIAVALTSKAFSKTKACVSKYKYYTAKLRMTQNFLTVVSFQTLDNPDPTMRSIRPIAVMGKHMDCRVPVMA